MSLISFKTDIHSADEEATTASIIISSRSFMEITSDPQSPTALPHHPSYSGPSHNTERVPRNPTTPTGLSLSHRHQPSHPRRVHISANQYYLRLPNNLSKSTRHYFQVFVLLPLLLPFNNSHFGQLSVVPNLTSCSSLRGTQRLLACMGCFGGDQISAHPLHITFRCCA